MGQHHFIQLRDDLDGNESRMHLAREVASLSPVSAASFWQRFDRGSARRRAKHAVLGCV